MRLTIITVLITGILISTGGLSQASVPGRINYQGYLTNSEGVPLNGTYTMVFSLYDALIEGSVLWSESQAVYIENGIYNVILGQPNNELTPDLFSGNLFLGVAIDTDPEMTPRQQLTATPFALKAAKSEDSDKVGGKTASQLDQSGHVADTSNPHQVTPLQIGAATLSEIVSHEGDASAHHTKTTSFTELEDSVTEAQIPPEIARDSELTWGNLSGLPTGFADGIDNDSGGDITGVYAGTGLTGGANHGEAYLDIEVPLSLWKFDGDDPTILGRSFNGSGSGVKGELYSDGNTNSGTLGSQFSGVSGVGSGTSSGVYGSNENGNYGYLGGPIYGVYGSAIDTNSFAGYFNGKTTIAGGIFELYNNSGSNWINILRGTNQHGGLAFKEEGAADTQWIFPYFRGWQSDNLIVRDELTNLDVMTFELQTGRVGIGTGSPSEKLDINGNLNVTGNIEVSASINSDSLTVSTPENISWSEKTGYYAVPPAAFQGNKIYYIMDDVSGGPKVTVAPVNLPDSATVTKVVAYFNDSTEGGNGEVILQRIKYSELSLDLPSYDMAYVESSGSSGITTPYETVDIIHPVIDNFSFYYCVKLILDHIDTPFYGLIIEYTYKDPRK